jgi:hypothetical protein
VGGVEISVSAASSASRMLVAAQLLALRGGQRADVRQRKQHVVVVVVPDHAQLIAGNGAELDPVSGAVLGVGELVAVRHRVAAVQDDGEAWVGVEHVEGDRCRARAGQGAAGLGTVSPV